MHNIAASQASPSGVGICTFCQQNIIDSNKLWDYHHADVHSVCSSSAEGCIFCDQLYGDYATKQLAFRHADLKDWPLYRWSIRRPGMVRESLENLVLTFRPTNDPVIKDTSLSSEANSLQEESFLFFRDTPLDTSDRRLVDRTDSEQSWTQANDWLKDCIANHPKCRQLKDTDTFMPTRLLRIDCPERSNIKLVKTAKHKIKEPYATLSHCWGLKSFINLTPQNKKWLIETGVSWDRLPLNFKHAIQVARKLGLRYIWIDSLCIKQGHKGDFGHEANLMHKVYRGSSCNIAATDSSDSRGGLFRERNVRDIVPTICQATVHSVSFGDKAWRVISKRYWETQLLDKTLYSRAWVFQERMLAPRILHYSSDQILWDCATVSACEAFPIGIPKFIDTTAKIDRHWRMRLRNNRSLKYRPLSGEEDGSMEIFWKSAVENYSRCDLTHGKDKLKAIWGIAKLVRDAIGGQNFIAGLWSYRLEEQLAWNVISHEQGTGRPTERPFPHRQPSWSWASMDAIIEVQTRFGPERTFVVTDHLDRNINTLFEHTATLERYHKTHEKDEHTWKLELERMGKSLAEITRMSGKERRNSQPRDIDAHRQQPEEEDKMPELTPFGPGKTSFVTEEEDRNDNTLLEHSTTLGRVHKTHEKDQHNWKLELERIDESPVETASMSSKEDINSQPSDIDAHRQHLEDEDIMPELTPLNWSIPIKCNIGEAQVVKSDESWKWTFGFHSSFLVYPDVDPGAKSFKCLFATLAYSDDEDSYSGLGILLNAVKDTKDRYYRCGSFRFEAVDEISFNTMRERYIGVTEEDGSLSEEMHKIWLD
ncbi:HET-domain-containing protein [Pseudovirgaria hyperparasitica]|uniref:HET-domain-containing protein n=1 Tax=Pseudovirgaria hyperparasitica TaxID=470096 RepID=A0A6A6WE23_9PEZI|nr:HET-domain-containing protein [Pseudovirgaria hyperparasitica]KAF2761058.1 HET-domain-containing protein [Pseudovirgaria hyperparasitica]